MLGAVRALRREGLTRALAMWAGERRGATASRRSARPPTGNATTSTAPPPELTRRAAVAPATPRPFLASHGSTDTRAIARQHDPRAFRSVIVSAALERKARRDAQHAKARAVSAALATAPTSFAALGLSDELLAALVEAGIERPTPIQRLAIPDLLAGAHGICAAQTGTGKTLAYLLPLVQRLKAVEASEGRASARRPRAIVLVPSRELSRQVSTVAKALSHVCKFRTVCLTGGDDRAAQKRALDTPVDLLVATPGRLLDLHAAGHVHTTDVRTLVVDEADTTLDGFEAEKVFVPAARRAEQRERALQCVLVSATITPPVRAFTRRFMENSPLRLATWRGPRVGLTVPTLRQSFVRVLGADKHQALVDALRSLPSVRAMPTARSGLEPAVDAATATRSQLATGIDATTGMTGAGTAGAARAVDGATRAPTAALRGASPANKVMVFCNTVASCRSTEHVLAESGFRTVCVHGEIPPAKRAGYFAQFLADEHAVLVTTDVVSRGLDVPSLAAVVQFDFPTSAADYLHRAGRTARAGAAGTVISLVARRDRALAAKIESAIERRVPLVDESEPEEKAYTRGARKSAREQSGASSGASSGAPSGRLRGKPSATKRVGARVART